MIISRTPLRMSFVGGGTDLASFYQKFGGAVLATSIDKYVYVTVNKKFDEHIRLSYSKTENVSDAKHIEHNIVREVLGKLEVSGGLEITSIADIPSKGTGLGSSSSFTVGLLHALNAYKGNYASAEYLANESCIVEIDLCQEPIGKQDQFTAAFGGFNVVTFHPDDSVSVDPLVCKKSTTDALQDGLVVFYTGITRSASKLLEMQNAAVENDVEKQNALKSMKGLVYDLRDELTKNNIQAFGEILHENWLLKKSLVRGVSNNKIDEWYNRARSAGATGGKLMGAGAGGFLLFYAPPEKKQAVVHALAELRHVDMRFENSGSSIIFYH